jgi:hypothetical protein
MPLAFLAGRISWGYQRGLLAWRAMTADGAPVNAAVLVQVPEGGRHLVPSSGPYADAVPKPRACASLAAETAGCLSQRRALRSAAGWLGSVGMPMWGAAPCLPQWCHTPPVQGLNAAPAQQPPTLLHRKVITPLSLHAKTAYAQNLAVARPHLSPPPIFFLCVHVFGGGGGGGPGALEF